MAALATGSVGGRALLMGAFCARRPAGAARRKAADGPVEEGAAEGRGLRAASRGAARGGGRAHRARGDDAGEVSLSTASGQCYPSRRDALQFSYALRAMVPSTTVQHPTGLDLSKLPQVPKEAVRLLWVSDYYDGVLAGVAEHRGRRHLLLIAEIEQFGSPSEVRRWVLYALTDEQLRNEEHWNMLFRQHVNSTQGDFTGVPPPALVGDPDRDAHFARYEAEYRPPLLELGQAVGWCDDYFVLR